MTDNTNSLITSFQKGIEQLKVESFWNGFDACLEMVFNSLDNQESNELATMNCWEFIEDFKQHLHEEADLYKKDG